MNRIVTLKDTWATKGDAAEAAGKYKNEDSDTAFQAQLDSAAKQMASLQRIQDELKQDESKFQQEIAGEVYDKGVRRVQ